MCLCTGNLKRRLHASILLNQSKSPDKNDRTPINIEPNQLFAGEKMNTQNTVIESSQKTVGLFKLSSVRFKVPLSTWILCFSDGMEVVYRKATQIEKIDAVGKSDI